jgi:hypothetical protein
LTSAACAQTAGRIEDHIAWDRTFPQLAISIPDAAAVDPHGVLWVVAGAQILRIDPEGNLLGMTEIPGRGDPKPPSTGADARLAISPRGKAVLLIQYKHFSGRVIYEDEVKVAAISENGSVGALTTIANDGAQYQKVLALTDEHFLALGDQEPLTFLRFDESGTVSWKLKFSKELLLPQAAAVNNGATCIANWSYGGAHKIELIRLSAAGKVTHRATIVARRANAAAGPEDSCVVLYDTEPDHRQGEFHLTSFDAKFKRTWTTPVSFDAPPGGEFDLVGLHGGFGIVAHSKSGVFFAKYGVNGKIIWSVVDPTRYYNGTAVGSGDHFYVVGVNPNDRYNLHFIRLR